MAEQSVGRDTVVNFAIGLASANPAGLTFKRLGMARGKSIKTAWDTVDTTADMSPQFTKTSLVTFKQVEFSADGVSYTEDMTNQLEFKAHVINPGSGTNFQPMVWLQLVELDGSLYQGPFIVTEWSDEYPYSDVVTWSTAASSNGAVTFTPAP